MARGTLPGEYIIIVSGLLSLYFMCCYKKDSHSPRGCISKTAQNIILKTRYPCPVADVLARSLCNFVMNISCNCHSGVLVGIYDVYIFSISSSTIISVELGHDYHRTYNNYYQKCRASYLITII